METLIFCVIITSKEEEMIGLRALQAASWTDSDLSRYKSVKMTFEYEKWDFFFLSEAWL